jgi:hypothetical protein
MWQWSETAPPHGQQVFSMSPQHGPEARLQEVRGWNLELSGCQQHNPTGLDNSHAGSVGIWLI